MHRFVLALLLGAAVVGAPALARANGRFPASNHMVVHPADANRILLRTTFGMLITSDQGKNWDWICEKAVGYSGTDDPAVEVSAAGTLIAGLFDGLAQSTDQGCGWNKVGAFTQQVVIDVAKRRANAKSVVAMTSTFKGQTDAGDSLFNNVIFRTSDDGATWQQLGPPLDSTVLTQTLDLAESDDKRIYVSGVRDVGPVRTGLLLVSTDEGQTWTEHTVPLTGDERAPFIAGVDPTNPARMYVRNQGAGPNRLLYTDDSGANFTTAFTTKGALKGFALSADGTKVFVGSQEDGLHMASAANMQFSKKSDVQVQCLMMSGTTLWACSNMISGFIVGSSADDGATFTASLKLDGVRGPLSCGAGSSEAQCVADWPALREQLAGGSSSGDAGSTGDGGTNNGNPPGGGGGGGCSCNVSPREGGAAIAGVGAAIALLSMRRRRKR